MNPDGSTASCVAPACVSGPVLPRESIRELLMTNSKIAFRFIKVVGDRRRLMETKIEHLVFRDVHAKLAALLLELGVEHGKETEDGLQIDQKITHQEMANLIGSTRETISLTLDREQVLRTWCVRKQL